MRQKVIKLVFAMNLYDFGTYIYLGMTLNIRTCRIL